MKSSGITFFIAVLFSLAGFAQPSEHKLIGYWMESDLDQINSLSTLLVFNQDAKGGIEGAVFFMDSDDFTQEFVLSKINLEGNSFSFTIKQTTITFVGTLNDQHSNLSGSFTLEGKTCIKASHQKLDSARIEKLIQKKQCVPRKEIKHTDGLTIG